MEGKQSNNKPFQLMESTWRCWIVGEGGSSRYEWREECGRITAGRDPEDFKRWIIEIDGVQQTRHFPSLKQAMLGALGAIKTKKPAG